MTMIREFFSNFTKIKRTPILLLHLLLPTVVTALFFIYYAFAGYHIIPDVRLFFVILQICYPIFVSIVVPVFINLDRNVNDVQNALGLVKSRGSVYLGKLLFLLFLFAVSMVIYELCFYIGADLILGISVTHFGSYFVLFCIFIIGNLFIYMFHVPIAFRFGSGISVLSGIGGTILAGFLENAIGDKIWPIIPWEWGVRFLEKYFRFSRGPILGGSISLLVLTFMILVLSMLWYSKWEGKIIQE